MLSNDTSTVTTITSSSTEKALIVDPQPVTASTSSSTTSNAPKTEDIEWNFTATGTSLGTADPYGLREGVRTEQQLAELRNRKKGKQIAKYQEGQNDLIGALLKPMEEHTEDARIEEDSTRIPVKIAVYTSMVANLLLCILQMYAAVSSSSLSLLSTGIDSVFDIGSNVVLYYLHRQATKLDVNKWPVGGSRLETIGNIIYGFLMSSVNLVVIVESVRALLTHEGSDLKNFHLPSIIAVAAALFVKGILFIYCFSLRKSSSQVLVLWEDHRNDLFLNGFGILMSCGGSKLRWWLDPTGAVIIGGGIIISWGITIYRQFCFLAGQSAPHDFLQLIIYKAATFSDEIEKVDTVRAYHSGPSYFVEVDIVMKSNTPLWKAHDVSQLLQDRIEVLPNVERAFVHVDHETSHTPEHRKPSTP